MSRSTSRGIVIFFRSLCSRRAAHAAPCPSPLHMDDDLRQVGQRERGRTPKESRLRPGVCLPLGTTLGARLIPRQQIKETSRCGGRGQSVRLAHTRTQCSAGLARTIRGQTRRAFWSPWRGAGIEGTDRSRTLRNSNIARSSQFCTHSAHHTRSCRSLHIPRWSTSAWRRTRTAMLVAAKGHGGSLLPRWHCWLQWDGRQREWMGWGQHDWRRQPAWIGRQGGWRRRGVR